MFLPYARTTRKRVGMAWVGLAGITAAFTAHLAEASFLDGNDLYARCAAPMGDVSLSFCNGYVAGISDALYEGNSVNGYKACIPSGPTVGQMADVVRQFLAANPASRHKASEGLVAHAISDAFPCR